VNRERESNGFQSLKLKQGTHAASVPMPPGPYSVQVTTVSDSNFTVKVAVAEYAWRDDRLGRVWVDARRLRTQRMN
jgi:hypothetical protein